MSKSPINDNLSLLLDTTKRQIGYFIHKKEEVYFSYPLSKKCGFRDIDAPKKSLKRIQRNILKKILYGRKAHKNAHGFVKNKSIITNGLAHTNKRIIFKTDIKDLFPSINSKRVKNVFEKTLKISEKDAYYLTELTTYKGVLPQGAPTSPHIANLICSQLDARLTGFAEICSLNYSRYADDIIFSGEKITQPMQKTILKIITDEGFRIAHRKTKILTRGDRQVVTGLIVNDKVSFGREEYRNLRASIHNCKSIGVVRAKKKTEEKIKKKIPNFRNYLMGRVNYLIGIDQEKGHVLKEELTKINWVGHTSYKYSEENNKLAHEIVRLIKNINGFIDRRFHV